MVTGLRLVLTELTFQLSRPVCFENINLEANSSPEVGIFGMLRIRMRADHDVVTAGVAAAVVRNVRSSFLFFEISEDTAPHRNLFSTVRNFSRLGLRLCALFA